MFREIQQALFNKAVFNLDLSDAHGYSPFFPDPIDPMPVVGGYKANPHEGMWVSIPSQRFGAESLRVATPCSGALEVSVRHFAGWQFQYRTFV